jgi:Asp-tRNA(Asn)/Glu-tRNA(Gln) amidotransferase A subunit family amidase
LTGHPALTLPAGRCANGVPFGLQVTGARHADDGLLDLAAAWEAAHPWPRVASGYEPFVLGDRPA